MTRGTIASLSLAVAVVACTRSSDAPTRAFDSSAMRAAERAPNVATPQPEGARKRLTTPPSAQLQQVAAESSAVPSMIIRNGNATIQVDSLELAVDQVELIATRLGGYVANTSITTGRQQLRSATLQLKIPASAWAGLISGLDPIGEIESISEQTQDVGEEFVDLSARMANARRLEKRLLDLLESRTGKLDDVLAVERELARVREEIERHEGRLRYLRSRVATSTLDLTLHETGPLVGGPGESVIGGAFRNAWRNFVQFIAWLIMASGVLIPLALIGLGLFYLGKRFKIFASR